MRRGDWCYALLTLVLSRFVFLLAFIFAFFLLSFTRDVSGLETLVSMPHGF